MFRFGTREFQFAGCVLLFLLFAAVGCQMSEEGLGQVSSSGGHGSQRDSTGGRQGAHGGASPIQVSSSSGGVVSDGGKAVRVSGGAGGGKHRGSGGISGHGGVAPGEADQGGDNGQGSDEDPTTSSGGVLSSGGTMSPGGGGGSVGATASGGTIGSGGSIVFSTQTPFASKPGFATRYWDCCKPSCAWGVNSLPAVPSCKVDGITRIDSGAKSACELGNADGAFQCYDFAPWYDSGTDVSYGFAASNTSDCGACYQLQFTGAGYSLPVDPGSLKLKGRKMIVQIVNVAAMLDGQFGLLIPGGGIGASPKVCPAQWGDSADLGADYGGLLAKCSNSASCMQGKCQSVFKAHPKLLAGCNWFADWFGAADNPKVIYQRVTCPSQLTNKSGISK